MENGNVNHKIRIHYINSPSFIYDDKRYDMKSVMIRNFSDIDSLIERHLRYCEKHNIITEMAIMNITNMHGDKPVLAFTGEYILFLRYQFFTSVEGQLPESIPVKI